MIQDIREGGIRLADLETMIYTAHLPWVRRLWLKPNSTTALALRQLLGNQTIHNILLSNTNWASRLHPCYAFFRQIMTTWFKFHRNTPTTTEQVQDELLWNNDFISIDRQHIDKQALKVAGINTINDVLHTTQPRFLSHDEINNRYGISSNILDVYQIRAAIPCQCKRLLRTPAKQGNQGQLFILSKNKKRFYSWKRNRTRYTQH